MAPADALAALLRDRGAENVDHPGGSLDAHLRRVQARQPDLDMPEPVQHKRSTSPSTHPVAWSSTAPASGALPMGGPRC